MLAQMVQTPEGKESKSIWLDPITDSQIPGRFHGVLTVLLRTSGRYVLRVRLSGDSRSHERTFTDYSEVSFSVQPSLWQRIHTKWPWIALFSGLLIIIFVVYRLQLPKLMGTVYTQRSAGESTSYNLRNFGHRATIGGGNCDILIDPETKIRRGYLVAKRRKTEEGFKRSIPQIHYTLSADSKNYTVRDLNNGDTVAINGAVLEYHF